MEYVLNVNGNSMPIKRMGASGVAQFANVLGRLTLDGRKILKESKIGDGGGDFIWSVLAAVSEDGLIKLSMALTGFPEDFVKENFALDWVSDALVFQFESSNLKSVVANFTRLASQTQA